MAALIIGGEENQIQTGEKKRNKRIKIVQKMTAIKLGLNFGLTKIPDRVASDDFLC